MAQSILVTWIGHTDLRAMANDSSGEIREKVISICGKPKKEDGIGPVKTAVSKRTFNAVHLFSNYPNLIGQAFKKWLGIPGTEVHSVQIDKPTNYKAVYQATDRALATVVSGDKNAGMNILLSPGTPTMAAIFVLLGKTKYKAHFLQTYNNQLFDEEIPFDIAVDVIPEIMSGADKSLELLTRLSPREIQGFEKIIGDSKGIRLAVGRAQRAALRDISVLLTGESGTGKELFALAIHAASRRKDKPYKIVNCAAIPANLLESELFGHVKGAFTGATENHDGAFKQADGGVLFLDEVGECSPEVQAKLLRVLQPVEGQHTGIREVQPIGSRTKIKVDVRVIAATNRDLLEYVEKGAFRSDLYYRLAVITINLPSLRERKSDIQPIAATILDQINKDFAIQEPGYKHKYLCDSAIKFIRTYSWPGNVRELYNVLIQAAVMSSSDEITRDDVAQCLASSSSVKVQGNILSRPLGDDFSLDSVVDEVQTHYIKLALEETGNVKARAAQLLGLSNYQTLDAKMKKFGIRPTE